MGGDADGRTRFRADSAEAFESCRRVRPAAATRVSPNYRNHESKLTLLAEAFESCR